VTEPKKTFKGFCHMMRQEILVDPPILTGTFSKPHQNAFSAWAVQWKMYWQLQWVHSTYVPSEWAQWVPPEERQVCHAVFSSCDLALARKIEQKTSYYGKYQHSRDRVGVHFKQVGRPAKTLLVHRLIPPKCLLLSEYIFSVSACRQKHL
jgi:hypothetical protein